MLKEISGNELHQTVDYFRNRIETELTFKGEIKLSFPGGESEVGDNYEKPTPYGLLSITIVPNKENLNRYIHFINLDQTNGTLASDTEINIPKVLDRRVSTLLAKEITHRYICNRGKFTVYKSSIKKSIVLDYFADKFNNVFEIMENEIETSVIRVANLDSKSLFDEIALFTKQLKTFKEQFRQAY